MSFTAEVKDELSRVEGHCESCDIAELAALVRVCGALSFHGSGAYSIRVSTETGAVARTVIHLAHKVFYLDTSLTVRRSNLHKTRNYLIEIPEQKGLEQALIKMGVLVLGRGLSSGIAARVVARPCCRAAYLRGAFMAGRLHRRPPRGLPPGDRRDGRRVRRRPHRSCSTTRTSRRA